MRSSDHRAVIAGPGAGKTELLAQRAVYLLQTGNCPAPRRILAISYKRSSARTLAERVHARCHHSDAARFTSMTFDAFAKSLLDRFGQTLPRRWRPRPDYAILSTGTIGQVHRNFLQQIGEPPLDIGTRAEVEAIDPRRCCRARYALFGNHAGSHRRMEAAPTVEEAFAGPLHVLTNWSALHQGSQSCVDGASLMIWAVGPSSSPGMEREIPLSSPCRAGDLFSHLHAIQFQDTTSRSRYDLMLTLFARTRHAAYCRGRAPASSQIMDLCQRRTGSTHLAALAARCVGRAGPRCG